MVLGWMSDGSSSQILGGSGYATFPYLGHSLDYWRERAIWDIFCYGFHGNGIGVWAVSEVVIDAHFNR